MPNGEQEQLAGLPGFLLPEAPQETVFDPDVARQQGTFFGRGDVQRDVDLPQTEAEQLQQQTAAQIQALQQQALSQPAVAQAVQRTVQSAPLSRAQAAQQLAVSREREKQVTEQLTGATQRLSALQGEIKDASAAAINTLQTLSNQLGDRAPVLRRQFEEEQKNFANLRKEIEQKDIDPNRVFDSMPTWARSLVLVANAFQRRDPRTGRMPVSDIINQAIARDVSAQKVNLARRLDLLNVSARQKDIAMQRLDNNLRDRMDVALKLTRAQMGRLASEQQSVTQQLQLFREASKIGQSEQELRVGLQQAARARATTVTQAQATDRRAQAAEVAKVKFTEKEDRQFLINAAATADDLTELSQLMARVRRTTPGGKIGAFIKGTLPGFENESKVLNGLRGRIALNLAKAVSGATITDAERKSFESAVPKLLSTDSAARTQAQILMRQGIRGLIRRADLLRKEGNIAGANEYARFAVELEQRTRQITSLLGGE